MNKENEATDTTNVLQIPLVAHESAMERLETTNKRLFILVLVLITYSFIVTAVMIASNYWWIEYEKQFSDTVTTTTTVTQEGDVTDGGTILLNNGGDLTYGEGKTDSNNSND